MNRARKIKMPGVAWLYIGMLGMGLFGLGLAIFLSVKSSPCMSAVRWLPHFITAWADRHGRLCNFPAFAMLAIPFLAFAPGLLNRACVTASLAIFVAALEIFQIWIPTRSADEWDVFWGWSGLLTSWAVFEATQLMLRGNRHSFLRASLDDSDH
jgi:hypothetical protein